MSLSPCNGVGGISLQYPDDFCLNVIVEKDQDEFDVDPAWMAGATFLGLFLGAGIVLLCARPFLAAWEKKKRQDEEKLLEKGGKVVEAKAVNDGWIGKDDGNIGLVAASPAKEKKGFFQGMKLFSKKKESVVITAKEEDEEKIAEEKSKAAQGMVDIMIQTNSANAEVEMADQDMTNLVTMEKEQDQEKDILMLRTMALLLRKKMEKRIITKNFYVDFVKKSEEDMRDLNSMLNREKADDEKKLKNDSSLKKDPQAMQNEMDKLQTHFSNKAGKLHRDYRHEMRNNLLRSSGMSEAEVDDLMEKLMKNMCVVEEKIGLEQARQRRALEQRLAKRRQALEYHEAEAKDNADSDDERVELLKDLLSGKDSSMLEKQNDEIITAYANDLCDIRKLHRKEYEGLLLNKIDFLKKNRESHLQKLNKKQEKEKAAIIQMSDKGTSEDFIKVYHDLMVKHHIEKEVLNGDLDQREVQELHKLKQEVTKEENKAVERAGEKIAEALEESSNLSHQEAQKLMKLHKQQMANSNARRQKEKQAMLARLEERLQQRLSAADEAEARDQKEQETLKEEQMATMHKVLAQNMDLTEEAKERVLREHEQNMQALSNQLMRSKLRQQKSLEIKLNQRKAKMAELKKQQEDLERSGAKGKEDAQAILAAQIAKEEENFEAARKAAVADLRRRLADETNEALKQQDEEIGLLIGRLQVGQARRKAILERQDATLKQLQDELEKKVAGGEAMPTNVTDQIIQQHYNQVSHLNEQIQRRRGEQQKMIMEKLTRKKTMLENEIETQLEEDAQTEYSERKQKGAGYASLALMQNFLEQRHSKAMQELQDEMTAELEKSKNDLNSEMELELKKELETQRQNLLTQLATVKNVSNKDLHAAMSAATKGSYDNKAALRMVKDMKNEMERARSSLDYSDNHRSNMAYQRSSSDLNSPRNRTMRQESARSFRREPRSAFGIDEDDDEEGF